MCRQITRQKKTKPYSNRTHHLHNRNGLLYSNNFVEVRNVNRGKVVGVHDAMNSHIQHVRCQKRSG